MHAQLQDSLSCSHSEYYIANHMIASMHITPALLLYFQLANYCIRDHVHYAQYEFYFQQLDMHSLAICYIIAISVNKI